MVKKNKKQSESKKLLVKSFTNKFDSIKEKIQSITPMLNSTMPGDYFNDNPFPEKDIEDAITSYLDALHIREINEIPRAINEIQSAFEWFVYNENNNSLKEANPKQIFKVQEEILEVNKEINKILSDIYRLNADINENIIDINSRYSKDYQKTYEELSEFIKNQKLLVDKISKSVSQYEDTETRGSEWDENARRLIYTLLNNYIRLTGKEIRPSFTNITDNKYYASEHIVSKDFLFIKRLVEILKDWLCEYNLNPEDLIEHIASIIKKIYDNKLCPKL